MKFKNSITNTIVAVFIFISAVVISSCNKYVDIPVGKGLLSVAQAYSTDSAATGAVLSLYSTSTNTSCVQYFTYLGGVSSDELQYTSFDPAITEFAQDEVSTSNGYDNADLWYYPYQEIEYANQNIAGITASAGISAATKNQLLGECKFVRAFMFFYMVNFYGGVPLSLDPTPLNNAKLPRASTAAVYAQIQSDLTDAISELPAAYAGNASLKTRPNKWAATALLARVDLYLKDYSDAATLSGQVINSGVYTMESLNNVFLNTSNEAILQFATKQGYSTIASSFLTATPGNNIAPAIYVLYPNFINSFEPGDNRKSSWVTSTTYNGVTYNEIYKWKLATAQDGNEYNMILRLAEMYLIRSEAEAEQGDLSTAQADLNVVRNRAGLGNTTASSQSDLLAAILQERKVEFFGEFSNRWLDLKRSGQLDAVMAPLKSTYKPTAALYPIPYSQILLNSNLTQNPGY
jgi:hypothetical protein